MDGWITIGTKLDTKDFDAQIERVESDLNELMAEYEILKENDAFNEQGMEARKLREDIEKTKNKLVDLRKKQEELNDTSLKNVQESMNGIGVSTDKLIKKIAKWSLAIFGIRSAYQFVRQSASTLSQYNEQMATDIEYIRFALASTLQPVIEWMVKAVFT